MSNTIDPVAGHEQNLANAGFGNVRSELDSVKKALRSRLGELRLILKDLILTSEVARQRRQIDDQPIAATFFGTVYLEVHLLCREHEDAEALIAFYEKLAACSKDMIQRQAANFPTGIFVGIATRISEAEGRRKLVESRFNLRGSNFHRYVARLFACEAEMDQIRFLLKNLDSKPALKEVPVEEQFTEKAIVIPDAEPRELRRREQRIVIAYRSFLESRGYRIVRYQMRAEGEDSPIYCDLYDATRNLLVEAKGSCSRDSIRMAVGQLADNVRFINPRPLMAVLLPSRPTKDLENLLRSQSISVIWQCETGFADNAEGRFL